MATASSSSSPTPKKKIQKQIHNLAKQRSKDSQDHSNMRDSYIRFVNQDVFFKKLEHSRRMKLKHINLVFIPPTKQKKKQVLVAFC